MKIAFIVGTFPSLSETFILNQITGLIDRGHEVHIHPVNGLPKNYTGKMHPIVELGTGSNAATYTKLNKTEEDTDSDAKNSRIFDGGYGVV
jgi:hypothetical protein